MKRILKTTAIALLLVLGGVWRNEAAAQPSADEEVTYQTFYDELSPHGEWVDNPDHGYVWVPQAEQDFRPYSTNGHWVYTDDYEWMWVSDYDWGWAPFHYGRWEQDQYYGWFWVPGYEWSPAWVAWRDGGDYYGWAPLRPGINVSVNFSIGSYSPPYDYWCFTPRRYITSPNIWNHYIDRGRNVTIINQTTIINNYNYSRNVFRTGPRRVDVEIYAGRVTPVRFAPSSRPGRSVFRNNEVNIYRPRVARDDNRRFAPRNVERFDRTRSVNNNRGNDRGNRNDGRINRNENRDRSSNNRPGRNDNNRFDRRDGNNDRGNNNGVIRNNDNNPNRERTNRQFDRNAETPGRTPHNGGTDGSPGRTRREVGERTNPGNNDGVSRQRDQNRMSRREDQPATNPGSSNGNRTFERRNVERTNEQPRVREPRQQNSERTSQPRMEQRRMEQPRMEQRQPQTRQVEQRQSQPRQVERAPQQQQQPRQFERRDNGNSNRQPSSPGNNGGGGRGRSSRGQ